MTIILGLFGYGLITLAVTLACVSVFNATIPGGSGFRQEIGK